MHITNLLSQYFGKFAKKRVSKTYSRVHKWCLYKIYETRFKEFKNSKHYKSLNELFTRDLIIKRDR